MFYSGNKISLNQWYKLHWTKRQKLKEEIINSLSIVQKAVIPSTYQVIVNYNGRNDVDNVVSLIKVILDHLRRNNYLVDDNTKLFKSLSITYDNALGKDFYQVVVQSIEDQSS